MQRILGTVSTQNYYYNSVTKLWEAGAAPITDAALRATDLKVTLDSEEVAVNLKAYRSSDTSYQPLRLDKATNSIQTIDYVHHEIHAGSSFMYHDVIASLADTVVQDYWIVTPNTTTWPHIGHSVESIGPLTLEIFEGADRTSAKTEQTVYNRDRNSGTAATTKIYKSDSTGAASGGTTDGTRIIWWKGGVANNKVQNGTNVGTSNEKILKQNKTYIFRITSGMAANLISLSFDWYEHANIA